ncbi:hypothetical protein K3757_07155 [Sulfitobacter sp. S223]|uniref:hypothetical protein n=1 Tax=Sulfitobacter sp. S223 TaxID=2867023 RepID=UPI0021A39707|nr:hypothetical protein [Sulfitobacter sp. S223]UWR27706.1 hypothetical protein K3757_07155 [Sulfitobacter sp. S223]
MADPFAATLSLWPAPARAAFTDMRAVILAAAAGSGAGPLTESLKWGQPAWRPIRPRQGSTLRLMWQDNAPQTLALFVDCKTTLSATMQEIYPTEFQYETNRALRLALDRPLPLQAIDHLARLTFSYHLKR